MKVKYQTKGEFDIKEIKAELKPFGGKCAKFVDDKLEYIIDAKKQGCSLPTYERKRLHRIIQLDNY